MEEDVLERQTAGLEAYRLQGLSLGGVEVAREHAVTWLLGELCQEVCQVSLQINLIYGVFQSIWIILLIVLVIIIIVFVGGDEIRKQLPRKAFILVLFILPLILPLPHTTGI